MFDNIFRGFSFIKESFRLVTKDRDLIKPSIYSIFFGIFFTVITGIAIYLSSNMMPSELVYILVFLVLLGEYYISYFFTGMTAFLVYDYFKDGDATMSEAWAATKKNAVTLFYLSIISAIVFGYFIFGAMSGANAVAGALIAIVVAAVIIVLVIALSMYVMTAYHTCLFLWARSVEDAGTGAPGTVKPPAPIAGALGA